MSEYIVIPIFSDKFIHPLHEKNSVSLLYAKEVGSRSKILTINHHDQLETDNFDFLKDKIILTTNKKFLLYVYPFKKVYDLNLLNYYIDNNPISDDSHNNAIDFFDSRYDELNNINTVIPIFKHQEYYDKLSEKLEKIWKNKDSINFESYEEYNNESITSFYSIEKQGIAVKKEFNTKTKKHISNNKLYSNYELYTATGRPSNNFGGINFAALDKDKKKLIVPENDYLVEYDHDAYHVRLIADLIDYKFPEGSAHDHLAKLYCVDREEGKKLTFQYLYGRISWDVIQLNPFFDQVNTLIDILWEEFNKTSKIETPIYKRPIFKRNHKDIEKTKLFNYYIQATETEKNIKTIIELQRYLYKRNTSIILYMYDAFLIDFSEKDGIETLKNIKKILESDNYLTKAKLGYNYSEMKDITHKIDASNS